MSDGLSMMQRFEQTGKHLPSGVAFAINDGFRGLRSVTYAELKAQRIARQRDRLKRITAINAPEWRAAYVWTFYVPGVIYGGWHLYLCTLQEKRWVRGVKYPDTELAIGIMQLFPCGLLPIEENFYDWKEAFATTYAHGRKLGHKPQGVRFGWSLSDTGTRNFQIERPQP